MNREIKFRAWHKDLKKMFKIGQITLEKGIWNFESNDRDFIGMSIPYQPSFVLMQYTGLHDKNGKEIYEGDIVSKEVFDDTKPNYINKSYAKVVYIEELAGFYLVNKSNKILWEVADDKYNIEVVSTIYDNPELLGGE